MLKVHTRLAQDTGIPKENCFILENGDVLALTPNSARIASHFNAGSGIGDIGSIVLNNRRILSEESLVLAVATVNYNTKKIMAGPDILSRGFIYMRESGDLINQCQRILTRAINKALQDPKCNDNMIKETITGTIQPFLIEKTERHPMILPMVLTSEN